MSLEAEEAYNYLNKEAPCSKNENTILNAVNKTPMRVLARY